MKRQLTEWEKIFAKINQQETDFKIQKQVIQFNIQKKTTIKTNWPED